MASLTALLLSIVLGPWLIARLRQFQIGQHIREDGPKSHQKKAGTPTMGGILICVVDRDPDAAVGESERARGVGGARRPGQLRRDRVLGRLHEGRAQTQPGPDRAPERLALEIIAALLIGVLLLAMSARGHYSTSMNVPFLKNFNPDLLIHSLLRNPLDLSARVPAFSSGF